MTLLTVPIFVDEPADLEDALARAQDASGRGAQLIEWRLDELVTHDDGMETAKELLRRSPLPCIVTCRPAWEGGQYEGDEGSRLAFLDAVARAEWPPRYVDVEHVAFARDGAFRERWRDAAHAGDAPGLILSSHDFDGRPADLLRHVEAMRAEPAATAVKIAWLARSVRDNLEAFDLLADRGGPMIALCMGEFGLLSRVLARKFGGLLTFASVGEGAESAPGQPTIEALREQYRFDAIGAATRVYGVIGWPVGHSASPLVHNAGFAAVGHDGVYVPMPVPPEYEHFKATVGALVGHGRLGFAGASVTIPHKTHLVRFVREQGGVVEPLAERLGAANMLTVAPDGAVACTNTDAPAAVAALCAGMSIERAALAGQRVAVLGAGGVARAVAGELHDAGAHVVVFNRHEDRARELADALGVEAGGVLERVGDASFDVYVNATAIGMSGGPAPDDSPLPDDLLHADATVLDTVYSPERTLLVRRASARGARVVTGVAMFVEQAALQFEAWTKEPAPRDLFRRLLSQLQVTKGE